MHIIEVEDLKRTYIHKSGLFKGKKEIQAVKGISFVVEKGEIFGLLGQNGAGKTTTIKMLITMLAPTSGICKVLGFDTFGQENRIRNQINFIFGGEQGVYRRLSARDNLKYFANLYKLPLTIRNQRIDELLTLVDLQDKADLRVETFSKGMIQRLQIARGLLNKPKVLFMDEPTIGLDPLGMEMLHQVILNINAQGTTILLTTHNMHEADKLCNRIAIIKEGEMIALDTPPAIKEQIANRNIFEISLTQKQELLHHKIESLKGVVSIHVGDDEQQFRISCTNSFEMQEELFALIDPKIIKSFKHEEMTLEDAYISLVRKGEKK